MTRIKVVTILGTRPELVRLSRVIARLDGYTDHLLVHTGQNYDSDLNDVFFRDLDIRRPDFTLESDTSSLGAFLGSVLKEAETVLTRVRPDAVLVLGDTNSSIAAVIARRMNITVFHMEAGNRCFDPAVPEEVNRRIIDHCSDFNLVYTEHARRNLLREGIEPRRIFLTGSPLREVMTHYWDRVERSNVLVRLGLDAGSFLLVSMHREENVDDVERLRQLLATLTRLNAAFDMPVIVSTHPRTRNRLKAAGVDVKGDVRFCHPFGFVDYNFLQTRAYCVLSDSGSISEEASILSFPAVTIRNAMERPEAMDAGTIVLTGLDTDVIEQAVHLVVDGARESRARQVPSEYTIENCSERVVNLIVGTARLNRVWSNVHSGVVT